MGCISSKRALQDERAIPRDKPSGRISRRLITSSRRDEVVVVDADGGVAPQDVAATARLISKPPREGGGVGSPPAVGYEGEKKAPVRVEADPQLVARRVSGRQRREAAEHRGVGTEGNSRIVLVPNGVEAECVAAGWPAWLASVAGEALRGWVPRRADSFEKLDKIGQGTYSSVYKARDLETGKTVALKKVRFVNMDPESVRFMAREIHVLRKLDHPNIVKLEGLVTSKMSSGLYLVFEYMEHDLAGLAATPGIKFSEPQVKCYMQQLLNGLEHCHSHGVLHRDIKGSNLLIDNDGILKIADFGLATFFSPGKSQQLTSRVVTLWYRPPELLLGATDYGVAVDLWSAGCILAELLAGKPIMPGRTEVEQLHKIFKLCGSPSEEYWRKSKLPHATIFKPQQPYRCCVRETFKDFPPSALTLLDVILAVEPEYRGTAASALMSEFFTIKPLACDPSDLPKYPPSKEYDAKLREEEARRQRAAVLKGHRADSAREDYRDAKVPQVADANGEHERRPAHSKDKSSSDRYNTLEDGGRFLNVPSKATAHDAWREKIKEDDHRTVTGRSLSSSRGMSGREMRTHRTYMPLAGGGEMPQLRGLMPARSSRKLDNQNEGSNQLLWPEHRSKYNQVEATETSDKQEWAYHLLDRPSSSQKKHVKEPTTGHSSKKRIHYSGPLVPPGGNMEEMLREHEKQIQHAVRKARAGRPR